MLLSYVDREFYVVKPIKLYASKRKYSLFLGISLIFVISGIFLMLQNDSEARVVGLLCTVFFGLCVAVFIFQLFDAKPRIIIDDAGILDRTLGVGLIPWTEITNTYLGSISGNDFICLELKDEALWVNKLSAIKRGLTKGNKALGYGSLNINLSGVKADAQVILEIMELKISQV